MPAFGEGGMTEAQYGERIARMEAKMEAEMQYMKRDIGEVKADVADIKAKQDKIIEMMTEANGMRKLIRWLYVTGVVASGFVATYWSSFKGFFAKIGG